MPSSSTLRTNNVQVVDPIVVHAQGDGRCNDTTCILCAENVLAERFPSPPTYHQARVAPNRPNTPVQENVRRPGRGARIMRFKLDIQIRIPSFGRRQD